MAKGSQADHVFRNRRKRILGFDKSNWMRGFFALSSAVAIFILLSIIGSLLKEGYDFVPTNHERLSVLRETGGEYANFVEDDLNLHSDEYGKLNRAFSQEWISQTETAANRRQAGVAVLNALNSQIGSYRKRLEVERKAGRDLTKLEGLIRERKDAWFADGGLVQAVEQSDSAEPEYLEEELTLFDGKSTEIESLLSQPSVEKGLNRYVWLRDPEALELVRQAISQNGQVVESVDNLIEGEESGSELVETEVESQAPWVSQVVVLGDQFFVPSKLLAEAISADYRNQENAQVWLWIGEENGVKSALESDAAPAEWSLWLWSAKQDLVDSLSQNQDALSLREKTNFASVLEGGLQKWAFASDRRPLILEGVEAERSDATKPVLAYYKLDRELVKEYKQASVNLAAMQKLMRAHIVETYATALQVALAPEEMAASLEGVASVIEKAALEKAIIKEALKEKVALKKALEKAEFAAAIELKPVDYDNRAKLIYALKEGLDMSNPETVKEKLLLLATVPTQEVSDGNLQEDNEEYKQQVDKAITSLFKSWEKTEVQGDSLSVENLYQDTANRLLFLKPQLLGELAALSERFVKFSQSSEYATLLNEMPQLKQTSEKFGESLLADENNSQAILQARKLGGELYSLLKEGEVQGAEQMLSQVQECIPLSPFDLEISKELKETFDQQYTSLANHFETRVDDERFAQWRHDDKRSWIASVWSFLAGKRWVTNNSPWFDLYGMRPLLVGSMTIALVAIFLCVPFAVGAAIFVNQFSNKFELNFIKPAIEFIEALPSVVLGFFGIVVLGTLLQDISETPWLSWVPGWPIEQRLNAFVAGVLLALMAVPTVFTLTEDAINNVPKSLVEASESLGASRVQTVFRVLIPTSLSGIIAAVLLGFGRVIGETMVVLLVAGGSLALLDFGQGVGAVFEPTHTMTGIIAQEVPEVSQGSEHWAALFMIGVVLFFLSLGINAFSRWVVNKFKPQF